MPLNSRCVSKNFKQSEDMQQEAVEVSMEAMEKFTIEKVWQLAVVVS